MKKLILVLTLAVSGALVGTASSAFADIPPGAGCKGLTNAYMRVVEKQGADSNAAQRLREQMRLHGCECPGHHS